MVFLTHSSQRCSYAVSRFSFPNDYYLQGQGWCVVTPQTLQES